MAKVGSRFEVVGLAAIVADLQWCARWNTRTIGTLVKRYVEQTSLELPKDAPKVVGVGWHPIEKPNIDGVRILVQFEGTQDPLLVDWSYQDMAVMAGKTDNVSSLAERRAQKGTQQYDQKR